VLIDSYHDRRTAFEFAVNAAGVKQDVTHNDSNNDVGWDAVWDVAIGRSPGMAGGIQDPFSQLRFNPASAGTFGFAVVAPSRTSTKPPRGRCWPGARAATSRRSAISRADAHRRSEEARVGAMSSRKWEPRLSRPGTR
jgi:hypothetical protein